MGKHVRKEEHIKLIMECHSSGLSDYRWCEQNGILNLQIYQERRIYFQFIREPQGYMCLREKYLWAIEEG